MKISLIIPAYNEEKQILSTLTQVIGYMEEMPFSYEIIVVNDGSQDKTAEMAEALCPYICLISYEENKGKGYAVARGIAAATGDYIYFTDADLSYDLGYIKTAESLFCQGAEVVIGKRDKNRQSYPPLRRKMSKMYQRLAEHILPFSTEDTQCGFKGFKKDAAKRLFCDLQTTGFGFDTEILCRASLFDMEIAEMEVDFSHRTASKVNLRSSVKMLRDLYRIRRELFENTDKG